MKSASLPRWLAWLFAFLFYGQLVGCVLAVGFSLYVATVGLPGEGTGNLVIKANISGTVTAPESMSETNTELKKWSKSTFDLKLNVPGSVNLQPVDNALNLSLAMNGPVDFSKLPTLLWLSSLSGLLVVLLSIYVSYVFMKLFLSLAARHIFDAQQTTRLMKIGYSLVLYAGLAFVVGRLSERGAILYLEQFGYSVSGRTTYSIGFGSPSAETISILTGLCILALAQVFKYGMELKQDSELTI